MIGRRIVIVGTTGSGKTTLAQQLSQVLNITHIELDNLFWKPNWEESTNNEFRQKIADALANFDQWVVDGNYSLTREMIWPKAETIIWLDYPLRVNFWRLFKRSLGRGLRKEKLWDAQNQERLKNQFASRDSLFIWAIKSYSRRRRNYTQIFRDNIYPHLHLIRLKTPQETNHWLSILKSSLE